MQRQAPAKLIQVLQVLVSSCRLRPAHFQTVCQPLWCSSATQRAVAGCFG